jgi:hypothetical protein
MTQPNEIAVAHIITPERRTLIQLATGQPYTYDRAVDFCRDAVDQRFASLARRAEALAEEAAMYRETELSDHDGPLVVGQGTYAHSPDIEPRLSMFESLMYISLGGVVIAAFALLWWATR